MRKNEFLKYKERRKRLFAILIFLSFAAMGVAFAFGSAFHKKTEVYAEVYPMPDGYALTAAEAFPTDGTSKNGLSLLSDKTYTVNDGSGLITIARVSKKYKLEGYTFRIGLRQKITLDIALDTNNNVIPESSFYGIGCDEHPFKGKLLLTGDTTDNTVIGFGANIAEKDSAFLFDNLSDTGSVTSDGDKFFLYSDGAFALCRTLTVTGDKTTLDLSGFRFGYADAGAAFRQTAGLVAASVKGSGVCSVNLSNAFDKSRQYAVTSSKGDAGGLFGVIEEGVGVEVTISSFSGAVTSGKQEGSAGILVGVNNGTFTLKADKEDGVVSVAGAATAKTDGFSGSFGKNNGTLTVGNAEIGGEFTGKYAGGIAGYTSNASTTELSGAVTASGLKASGDYAGGFIGYHFGKYLSAEGKSYTVTASEWKGNGSSSAIGGFFGVAEGTADPKGIYAAGSVSTDASSDKITFSNAGFMGGFAGKLSAKTELSGAVELSDFLVINAVFDCSVLPSEGAAGGFAGQVNAALTLLSDNGFTAEYQNAASGRIGGAIGEIQDSSLQTEITIGRKTAGGTFTVNNTFGRGKAFSGKLGGIAGSVGKAYFKADGISVQNAFSSFETGEIVADFVGAGEKGSFIDAGALIYQRTGGKSVMVYQTEEEAVLRLAGTIEDLSNTTLHIVYSQDNSLVFSDTTGFLYTVKTQEGNDIGNYGQVIRNEKLGVVTVGTDHTVTIASLSAGGDIAVSALKDFASLAVALQTEGRFNGTGVSFADLLKKKIILNCNISLTETGIEQLTRADKETAFTGSIAGGGHSVTLAIGENVKGKNVGIFSEDNERVRLGLFGTVSSGFSADKLTVNTSGDGILWQANLINDTAIGGIAGVALGNLSLESCTTNCKITLESGSSSLNKIIAVGGLIGKIENGDKLTVKNCNVEPEISAAGYGSEVYLGGIAGKVEKTTDAEADFTGNTVGTIINRTAGANVNYVGGCFGEFDCGENNYAELDFSGTVAKDASIVTNTGDGGGLIARWIVGATVTVNAAWSGTVSNGAGYKGGLLYGLDGKLVVEKDFTAGITIEGGGAKATLIGIGTKAIVYVYAAPENFETGAGNPGDFADYFVAKNINTTTSAGIGGSGGLVSIETGGDTGKITSSDAAWLGKINAKPNGNTHYYFNVAALGKQTVDISSPAGLVQWNIANYIRNSVPDYVIQKSGEFAATPAWSVSVTADLDMTDYCFYPTATGRVNFNFNDHKITFGKTTVSPASGNQFCGLQCGLLSDVTTASNDESGNPVDLQNVVLSGSVSAAPNGSGAFVCGKITGTYHASLNAVADVLIENVFFDGLKIEGVSSGDTTKVLPLLVYGFDSNVNCTLRTVSQYTKDTYNTAVKTNGYGSGAKAASSLLGYAGFIDGNKIASSNLSIVFENVVFEGETANSVFTRATFLETINGGSVTYNFNLSEDWSGSTHIKAVTYGREIAYEGQQMYFDVAVYVSPDSGQAFVAYAFDTEYYRYYVYENNSLILVNRKAATWGNGWGTYEHPYEISNADQLVTLAKLLSTESSASLIPEGWTIEYPKQNDSGLDYTQSDTYTADSSKKLYTESGNLLSFDDLRTYLQGAYYSITVSSLVLNDEAHKTFGGIGSATYPFHGVIRGITNNGAIVTEITMPQSIEGISNSGFGGFINVANGCALYGLNVRYGDVIFAGSNNSKVFQKALTTVAPTGQNISTEIAHFGGLIGWNVGGDSVIDSCKVSFGTVTAGHKTSVFGGYIGFVTGGGVTVKNLAEYSLTGDAYKNYLYYNSYVGKVLSGYVISKDQDYNNTKSLYDGKTDNYNYAVIPAVTADLTQPCNIYNDSDKSFTLATAEQLLLFSFASDNGAMSYAADRIGYGKGAMSRTGDYSAVGTGLSNITDGRYTDDSRTSGISVFSTYFGFASSADNSVDLTINFENTGYDLSGYRNAFRGIGSPLSAALALNVKQVNGNGATIRYDCTIRQYYQGDNPETDAFRNLGLFIEQAKWETVITFENITVSGNVSLGLIDESGNDATKKIANVNFCVGGMLACQGGASYTNVAVKDMNVFSCGYAGGLAGNQDFPRREYTPVSGCTIDNSFVEGKSATGALFGFTRAYDNNTYTLTTINVVNSTVKYTSSEQNSNAGAGAIFGLFQFSANTKGMVKIGSAEIRESAVLFESSVSGQNISAYAGGFIGNASGSASNTFGFSDCGLDGCTIAAYVKKEGISTTDDIVKAIGNSNNTHCGIGGFVGNITGTASFSSCRILSDSAATYIVGFGNASGFVPSFGAATKISFRDITVSAGEYDFYVIGKNCAAVLCSYSDAEITADVSDISVSGGEHKVYVMATGLYAGGLFGELESSSVTVENADMHGCIVAGNNIAGIARLIKEVKMTNVKMYDNCFISFGGGSAAGCVGRLNGGEMTINELYFADNIVSEKNGGAGLLVYSLVGEESLVSNYILLNKNGVYATPETLKYDGIYENGITVSGWEKRAVSLCYANGGTISIFGMSRIENDGFDGSEYASGTGTSSILYLSYGAPEKFAEEYAKDKTYKIITAFLEMNYTATLADGNKELSGDAVTTTGNEPTPDYENGLSWWQAKTDGTDPVMKTFSALLEENGFHSADMKNSGLPVLTIKGKTNETLVGFLTLITNGGYDGKGSLFTIGVESARYTVGSDGSLTATAKEGSVTYTEGKGFISGVYDNLTESATEKTITILTITFTSQLNGGYSQTLHIVIYYPQILEVKTFITVQAGEVYDVTSFIDTKLTTLDIPRKTSYSLYIEYAYNSVAENIEDYNFDKRIFSYELGNKAGSFGKQTTFMLIDLNSVKAYGYKYYTYTLENDAVEIGFSSFSVKSADSETGFTPKYLSEIIGMNLRSKKHLCEDKDFQRIERYLMVVIPSDDSTATQWNLKAQLEENDRNIVVNSGETGCSVSVWEKQTSTIDHTGGNKSFSVDPDGKMSVDAVTKVQFPTGYVSAMSSRKLYGTHIFKVQDDSGNTVVLPEDTVVRITDKNGKILLYLHVSGSVSTIRYNVGNVIEQADNVSDLYESGFYISLDFSDVSAKTFNSLFTDATYKLVHEFYLSSDENHYTLGTKVSQVSEFTPHTTDEAKVAVVPEDNKHLAINVADATDGTNDGKIYFGLSVDFSDLTDNEISTADVTFSISRKIYNQATGKYEYAADSSLTNSDSPFAKITLADGTAFGGTLQLENRTANLRLLLSVDKSVLLKDDGSYDATYLTNYKLVVTVKSKNGSEEVVKEAYFVFLLCNITADLN